MMRGVLEEHGIDSFVWHEVAGTLYGLNGFGGSRLVVEADDLSDARKLLAVQPEPIPEQDSRKSLAEVSPPTMLDLSAFIGLGALAGLVAGLTWMFIAALTAPFEALGNLTAFLLVLCTGCLMTAIVGTMAGFAAGLGASFGWRHPRVAALFLFASGYLTIITMP